MRRLLLFLVLPFFFAAPALLAQSSGDTLERREGTAPRASAAKYHAHAESAGVSFGTELLTRKQASKAFSADVNRCCLVVLVAMYPQKDAPLDLTFADFTLTQEGTDLPLRPESAAVTAAKLEKKKDADYAGVHVEPHGSVAYESGTYTDPNTGQTVRVRGVSTEVGVAGGTGVTVPPDVSDHSLEIIERELTAKGLPEAKVSIPVAGYLYFPISKPAKSAKYRLEFSGTSEPLTLTLP